MHIILCLSCYLPDALAAQSPAFFLRICTAQDSWILGVRCSTLSVNRSIAHALSVIAAGHRSNPDYSFDIEHEQLRALAVPSTLGSEQT